MDMELREKNKKRGLKRLGRSFLYSWDGLRYAFQNEQNLVVHTIVALVVILFGLYFKIRRMDWIICIILFGLVIATELINTALEAVVDLISPAYHPLAKIAKDTAAAAVFVFAITAVLAGILLFMPYLIK